MSMPSFPEESLNITCEQAFNMLLGSIAIEELALGHILNAEGEKLQYVLGTLPSKPCGCATQGEVLEVNQSISDLLERVAYNQLLLKGKLRQVLEAREKCCPVKPDCPPHSHSCPCIWAAEKNRVWLCDCPLIWKPGCSCSSEDSWQGCSPGRIHLCPHKTYLASFSFQLCASKAGKVQVALMASHQGRCEELLTCEGYAETSGQLVSLSGSTILSPTGALPGISSIQFVLVQPDRVAVERGELTLIVL